MVLPTWNLHLELVTASKLFTTDAEVNQDVLVTSWLLTVDTGCFMLG